MDQLIDAGHTFSGSEAKCAFLNLGNSTFATVSALSGFDFTDDGRSLALVDWDGDGDLDAWVTCRTAPMVRYLSNDAPRTNKSLVIRLEATSPAVSRDAAGARVEVRLKDQPGKPVMRTVKLGEGFLGQSSHRLHFGLGAGAGIASVSVTWPGGAREEIKDVRPNTSLHFVEGDLFPEITPFEIRPLPAGPSPLTPRRAALGGAVTLLQPPLFPPLPSVAPDGRPWTVNDTGGPVLINLFASWCPDCEEELTAWREGAARFKDAGLTLALLSADGRDTAHATGPPEAWAWLKKNRIPFPAGVLTEEAFRRLTAAHRQLFGVIVDLPVPSSFLLDGKGRLAAVYRGPVGIDRILADTALAVKDDAPARSAAALPWPGRWLQEPDPPDPSAWLNDLVSQSAWDEAFAFFQRHGATLRLHKDFALMAASLADKLLAAAKPAAALAAYDSGLTKSPDSPEILNNLASLLATSPDKSLRNPARSLTLAEKAVALTGGKNPVLLDTLASAQAAAGDFPAAAATTEKALTLARASAQTPLIPLLEKSLAAYRAGRLPQ